MPDLLQLGKDLQTIDRLIIDLVCRRMDIARLVGFEKKRLNHPMFRPDIENERLRAIATYAEMIGVNPNMAHSLLYALINESCKQQMILGQNPEACDLTSLDGQTRARVVRQNLLNLAEVAASDYTRVFYGNDFFHHIFTTCEESRIQSLVNQLPSRDKVLDIGCGAGRSSLFLSRFFTSVVGMDISQDMLYHAQLHAERESISNIEFMCFDAETVLPFEDKSLSCVTLTYGTASLFLDFPSLLQEIHRVLMPDGGAFLSFCNADSIAQSFTFLPWNVLAPIPSPYTQCLTLTVQSQQFSIHQQLYGMQDLQNILADSFELTGSGSYPFLVSILPVEMIERLENTDSIIDFEQKMSVRQGPYDGSFLACEVIRL